MKKPISAFIVSIGFAAAAQAVAANVDPGREAARAIFEEMIEIDTSPTGSCTKLVRLNEQRLKAAGFSNDDVQIVIPEGRPEEGNLVARIRSENATKKG